MPRWDVRISAPDGSEGHYTIDAGHDPQMIIDHFAKQVHAMAGKFELEDDGSKPGVPPAMQPVRKP